MPRADHPACVSVSRVSTVTFDVAAVRARFRALDRPTAFFDGPGGTQVPDSVIDAMARYLRESNANLGGPFETSRRSDEIVEEAHRAVARFLGATPDEVGFGANMTTLNFALSRTAARDWKRRRRGGRDAPRPRCERLSLARAGAGPGSASFGSSTSTTSAGSTSPTSSGSSRREPE